MKNLATTRMSVKGQVVIPEDVRKAIRLTAGDRFVVVGEGDTVLLQRLQAPKLDRYPGLQAEATQAAARVNGAVEAVAIDSDALAALCVRHSIRRLAVFGSVARGEATTRSDLDLLVEFEPGRKPGLRLFTIERELSQLLSRPVDLQTAEFLSPTFRDEALADAQDLYVRS